MRHLVSAAMLLLLSSTALAQGFHHHLRSAPAPGDDKRVSPCTKILTDAVPQPDVDKLDWNVSGNAVAKVFFSQGMIEYYGFNYEEAMRNFCMAKKKDPEMAMAAWGLALATGPNINLGMDDQCRALAIQESALAVQLATEQQKKHQISDIEVRLIKALPLRYAGLLTETVAYSVAMSAVWHQAQQEQAAALNAADMEALRNANGNVANIGALYAESLVEKRPWGLFDAAYKPALDTDEIVAVLGLAMLAQRCVIKDGTTVARPCAIGANHYWIHTAEASAKPSEARSSADVLLLAAPGAGHLVHMPSHIYFLQGDYKLGMESNAAAVAIDDEQFAYYCKGQYSEYSANACCPQLYYGHYPSHNHFFRAVSAAFRGQSREAAASACATRDHAQRFVANEPGLQRYLAASLQVKVMNRDWDAILNEKEPPPATCYMGPPANGCHIYRAVWYWAQGMAHAERSELARASCDYNRMADEMRGRGRSGREGRTAVRSPFLRARSRFKLKRGERGIRDRGRHGPRVAGGRRGEAVRDDGNG